ncbi:MAG: DUF362 domain-containing protein [Candidatus Omnitrophica bacterium]|nr:DUF362 domain-containing protein [Candidatus Omnitrophota bacterium]
MKSSVSLVKCSSYEPTEVYRSVARAIELLGGISGFIKPRSRVLIKPNLLLPKEPEFGITTHPEVVRAVIRLLKQIDCEITIGDGPSVFGGHFEDIDRVYQTSGMKKIAEEENVRLVRFSGRQQKGKFAFPACLDECDHLVNIPKFKTHGFMLLTGALKNLFGLVSCGQKLHLHKSHVYPVEFARVLAEIYASAKPSLNIIDAVVAMEGSGPGTCGKLRQTGLFMAGADGVALDAVMARIAGVDPFDVLSTKEAAARGLGNGELEKIDILGEELKEVIGAPFLLPDTGASLANKIPKPIVKLALKLIRYFPCIEYDNCVSCATCVKACPNKAIRMKKGKPVFDYSKCIACFCCQEVCPAAAVKIRKSLLAKIAGL